MYPGIRNLLTAAQLHQLLTAAPYGSESLPGGRGPTQSPPLSLLSGLGKGRSPLPRFPNKGLEEPASLSKGMPLF